MNRFRRGRSGHGRFDGKGHDKGGPLVGSAGDGDIASEHPTEAAADGEPEAGASVFARGRGVCLGEGFFLHEVPFGGKLGLGILEVVAIHVGDRWQRRQSASRLQPCQLDQALRVREDFQ